MSGEPLRVCHVAMGDLWAGAEVQLATLARYLIRYPDLAVSVVLFNEGRLADELRRLGVVVNIIPESQIEFLELVVRLGTLFRESRPRIVQTHKYKDNIACALASWGSGVEQVIRVVHGLPEPFRGLKSLNMLVYVTLDRLLSTWRVGKYVAVSESVLNALGRRHSSKDLVCIHNGVDLEQVRFSEEKRREVRARHGIGHGEAVLGMVGRLSPVKAQDRLLRAAQQLRVAGRLVKVLLVGDGPMREELYDLACSLQLDGHVIFTGHQERAIDYMSAMDVFVLPSLHEGIPMALLEALALERAVVATRVGGVPEVIEHGVHGLLVESGDDAALRNALQELLENPGKAATLGKAGHARVEQEFSAALMAERTVKMYYDVLSGISGSIHS